MTVSAYIYMGYFTSVAGGCLAFFPIDNYTLNNYDINITQVEVWGVARTINYKVESIFSNGIAISSTDFAASFIDYCPFIYVTLTRK